eukprot:2135415-Pleurochrysis_carterae.AAC.1
MSMSYRSLQGCVEAFKVCIVVARRVAACCLTGVIGGRWKRDERNDGFQGRLVLVRDDDVRVAIRHVRFVSTKGGYATTIHEHIASGCELRDARARQQMNRAQGYFVVRNGRHGWRGRRCGRGRRW